MKSKIYWFEPIIFIFFGLLHLHRVWAFADRSSYSNFWLSLYNNRGWFYFALMGFMAALCIAGIAVFVRNKKSNCWWRWFYIFGGGYVVFDLIAIFIRLDMWENLLYNWYDVANPYWNWIWGAFILLGAISSVIGIMLCFYLLRNNK